MISIETNNVRSSFLYHNVQLYLSDRNCGLLIGHLELFKIVIFLGRVNQNYSHRSDPRAFARFSLSLSETHFTEFRCSLNSSLQNAANRFLLSIFRLLIHYSMSFWGFAVLDKFGYLQYAAE